MDNQIKVDAELEKLGDHLTPETMPANLDIYQPKERFIFKYFDGEKMVVADPLILYKRLSSKIDEIEICVKTSSFPGYDKAEESYEKLVLTIRKIFKIKALEEGGLTPTELEDLLSQFLEYCHWNKKKWNPIATSPMEISEISVPSPEGSQPMQNTSDSGSTENVPNTVGQNPMQSERGSPTEHSTQAWSIGSTPETVKPMP